MDRLTYADKKVAAFIKKNFIAVRVDTDHRPDVNARYNVGGWPSTLVLAEDGEPVAGATYVPREKMMVFLEDGLARFSRHREVSLSARHANPVHLSADEMCAQVKGLYDNVNGGFGLEPKFPHPEILEYLIYRCELRKDQEALQMLDHALSVMLKGELFDHVQGGFFRYASLQNWTIPHFEKMLEDNAKLLLVYVRGFELLGRKEYLLAINKLLSLFFTVLYDKKSGVFYGSQDADEEFCRLPLKKRLEKKHPFVDKTVYTASNAAVVLALFEAGRLEPDYQDTALKVVRSLLKMLKGNVTHSIPSEGVCVLRDVVFLLMAVTGAFMVSKDAQFLREAKRLIKELLRFEDRENGGFFDIVPQKGAFGRLRVPRKQVYENACAALVLKSLAQLLGEQKYQGVALRALQAVSSQAAAQGGYAATYALALEEFGGRI